ncbi:MAG: glycosyltransferase, partial [Ginsengibacter sp.]
METRKKVDIVVINWNSGELTMEAIAPYLNYNSSYISCNVIIVDNASTDGSINQLKNQANILIKNKENAGFGKACNQAYKECDGDYILLLNPDTVSNVQVLEGLVKFMENNPRYGITGPTQLVKPGSPLKSCARFPTFFTALYEILGLSKVFPRIFTPAPQMTDWDHLKSK